MKRFCKCLLLLLLLWPVTGCGGLWHTTSTSQCAFVTDATRPGNGSTYRIEVAVLHGPKRNEEALAVVRHCLQRVGQGAQRSRALFYADCGILATYANGINVAKRALDKGIATFESVTIAGEHEKEASSLHGSESAKLFKGEPHERVLVYLHRGLLFLSEGDYENAHACFLNASLQDTMAERNRERGDWLTLDALLLLCKRAMGSESADEFAERCESRYAREIQSWRRLSKPFKRNPAIILIAVGRGPQKKTRRARAASTSLGYKEIPTHVAGIRVLAEGSAIDLACTDDVYLQAETRGRRNMDQLLARKARASENTDTAGTIAATTGIIVANVVPGVNLLGMAIQEAAMQESGRIDASADVRQLYSAAGKLYLGIVSQDSLTGSVRVEVLDRSGAQIGRQPIGLPSELGRPLVIVGRVPH